MNLLLVSLKDEFQHVLDYHLKPLGFQVVRLADPVKAIQKIEELRPEAVLFHAGDFPRHWKPLLKLLREKRSKEETVFVLLVAQDFELEEAAKAAFLGVNGISRADLSDKQEIYRLEELFRRYRTVRDKRNFNRLVPSETDVVGLAFTHPRRLTLVLGSLREISIQGASFQPNPACLTADLETGQEIRGASLLVGTEVISLDCRVTRNRREIGFQFLTFEEGGHHKLLRYIQGRAQRALQGTAGQETEGDGEHAAVSPEAQAPSAVPQPTGPSPAPAEPAPPPVEGHAPTPDAPAGAAESAGPAEDLEELDELEDVEEPAPVES